MRPRADFSLLLSLRSQPFTKKEADSLVKILINVSLAPKVNDNAIIFSY